MAEEVAENIRLPEHLCTSIVEIVHVLKGQVKIPAVTLGSLLGLEDAEVILQVCKDDLKCCKDIIIGWPCGADYIMFRHIEL